MIWVSVLAFGQLFHPMGEMGLFGGVGYGFVGGLRVFRQAMAL